MHYISITEKEISSGVPFILIFYLDEINAFIWLFLQYISTMPTYKLKINTFIEDKRRRESRSIVIKTKDMSKKRYILWIKGGPDFLVCQCVFIHQSFFGHSRLHQQQRREGIFYWRKPSGNNSCCLKNKQLKCWAISILSCSP